jgi:hypothetical protein
MSTSDEDGLESYLRSWWSVTYSRPLKDPLLAEYTLYDLLYEYHDKNERLRAAELTLEAETDKIEEAQTEETESWIEEEERKEREAEEAAAAKKAEDAWMLAELKKEHGDDFGEDVNISF